MREIIIAAWSVLDTAVTQAKLQDENIDINNDAKEKFAKLFKEKYEFIKETFMKKSVKSLDRHKVASIIMSTAIEADVIIYKGEVPKDNTFIGKYLIPTSAGLSFMQKRLNELLDEKGQKQIEQFHFPTAFSCKTPYLLIFARNLYFTNELTDWKLNLLDMSDKLFLLEYITLIKNGIDPTVLIEEE